MLDFSFNFEFSFEKILPPPKYKLRNVEGIGKTKFDKYLGKTNLVMDQMFQWGRNCLEKCNKLSTKRMVLEIITNIFYFCWELSLCLAVGYSSPRYWHTETFSPEIVKLQTQLKQSRLKNLPPKEISEIKQKLETARSKWNYSKKNELMTKMFRIDLNRFGRYLGLSNFLMGLSRFFFSFSVPPKQKGII